MRYRTLTSHPLGLPGVHFQHLLRMSFSQNNMPVLEILVGILVRVLDFLRRVPWLGVARPTAALQPRPAPLARQHRHRRRGLRARPRPLTLTLTLTLTLSLTP